VKAPVVVTTTSLSPRELARARVFELGECDPKREKPLTIGRDASCDFVIDDPSVSREHVLLEKDDDGWWLKDANSANGVYAEGRVVPRGQRRLLGDGVAAIRHGHATLAFLGEKELALYLDRALELLTQAVFQRGTTTRRAPRAETARVPKPILGELARDVTELERLLMAHKASPRFFLTFEGGPVLVAASAEEALRVAQRMPSAVVALEACGESGEPVVVLQRTAA
jgi:hypothetical protein